MVEDAETGICYIFRVLNIYSIHYAFLCKIQSITNSETNDKGPFIVVVPTYCLFGWCVCVIFEGQQHLNTSSGHST